MSIKLKTLEKELRSLQHAVNEARPTSASIRVDRMALFNLLQDHYAMNGALARRGEATASE